MKRHRPGAESAAAVSPRCRRCFSVQTAPDFLREERLPARLRRIFSGPASAKVELTLAVGEQLEHRAKYSGIYLKYFKAWLTMKLELQ